ncbi:hypothetical protein D3C86_1460080 [compost metagenome]
MRQRNEGEDRGKRCQDDGPRSLHRGFNHGMVVVQTRSLVLLDLLGEDQCVAHKDARQADKTQDRVKPERLVEQDQGRHDACKTERCCQHHHRHRRQAAYLKDDDDQGRCDHQWEHLHQGSIRLEGLLDIAAHLDCVAGRQRCNEWLESGHHLLRNLWRLCCLVNVGPDRHHRRSVTTLEDRLFEAHLRVADLIERDRTTVSCHEREVG